MIIGDDSLDFCELCRSLRFSTHCEYLILSSKTPFDMTNYVYMEWRNIVEFSIDELPAGEEILCISCYDNSLDFKKVLSCKELQLFINKHKKLLLDIRQEKKWNNQKIIKEIKNSYFDNYITLIEKKLHKLFLNESTKEINLDFILDYEGTLSLLGGVVITKTVPNNLHTTPIDSSLHQELQTNSLVKRHDYPIKNQIVSLNIKKDNCNEKLNTVLKTNQIQPYWINYRALGINLPLILIQNLLKRKIKTHYFVEPKDVGFDKSSIKPVYKFNFDTVYFDLDETLIWKGKPLKDIVELLVALLNQKKYSLKLLTRHELSIQDTLSKTGISESYFEEIIHVLPTQKKSSFITENNSIFIDNEFPQRLDVHLNCKIPVLDLYQIDFLHIDVK